MRKDDGIMILMLASMVIGALALISFTLFIKMLFAAGWLK